ncbi:sugar transferase [Chitinophaga sancti]|uniref:Sugar transferase n=1 Tax=Chitinophaga sancti TaxID=1004 RepID=A0A1K1N7N7_9BACT|nr:sugar transferase [Chitinophaga sancti]WQD63484.1 sugar transferase [Chitinophaga sancti]WQG90890.1 sugar transferase [Chitinophaga sancti]SFW31337.1 Sugar transferase involved in LPS biosynthesis (colanic, teichoic acid) [Chitinophaga sancti]
MISNLPLSYPDARKKTGTKVVALAKSHVNRYTLCIGNDEFFDCVTGRTDEYVFTAKELSLSVNVLKEQLLYDNVPTFIICNVHNNPQFNLRRLRDYMRTESRLAKVPVFVYAETISAELKQELRRIGGIDDILTPAITPEIFEEKLSMAQQIRQMAQDVEQEPSTVTIKPGYYLNYSIKRGLDILFAGTLLLLLSPVFLVLTILIKLDSKGPVFYVSRRAGNRYQIFKFYKFRTMVADADKQVAQMKHLNQYDTNGTGPVFFKVSNDPRVTPLGAFLRNSSLDELPQLLNVLLGHMSLVGNRPLPLYEAATLTTDDYAGRFLAPAGITGLWQIKKRGNKDMSVSERINLDKSYAEKHSVLYDMWILANTPNALRQKDNV